MLRGAYLTRSTFVDLIDKSKCYWLRSKLVLGKKTARRFGHLILSPVMKVQPILTIDTSKYLRA